ncbi:hypothetical protein DWUX_2598 [Desulfovibrio diazotrophicus]|nr:hypothetical protein DWUX_2598 [Desulfovibrio diazotrophicus]
MAWMWRRGVAKARTVVICHAELFRTGYARRIPSGKKVF